VNGALIGFGELDRRGDFGGALMFRWSIRIKIAKGY